jgi:hypothetical protein
MAADWNSHLVGFVDQDEPVRPVEVPADQEGETVERLRADRRVGVEENVDAGVAAGTEVQRLVIRRLTFEGNTAFGIRPGGENGTAPPCIALRSGESPC